MIAVKNPTILDAAEVTGMFLRSPSHKTWALRHGEDAPCPPGMKTTFSHRDVSGTTGITIPSNSTTITVPSTAPVSPVPLVCVPGVLHLPGGGQWPGDEGDGCPAGASVSAQVAPFLRHSTGKCSPWPFPISGK